MSIPGSSASGADVAPTVDASNTGATVTVIHSFTGGIASSSDGANPNDGLIEGSDGNLYGSTLGGGHEFPSFAGSGGFGASQIYGNGGLGSGTIFKITLPASETVQYAFALTGPRASSLIQASDGNFYGVSPDGCGVVFRLGSTGAPAILYSYVPQVAPGEGCPGLNPELIQGTDGNLYVTSMGWSRDEGVVPSQVLRITLAGAATEIANTPVTSFTGVSTTLVQGTDGNFYETLGTGGLSVGSGQGVVLKITPSGTVTVLHSFGSVPGDALSPTTPLIQATDGNLYGTTATGGTPSPTCPQGCGTVYKVSPAGVATVLYSFGSTSTDGQTPSGALFQAKDGNFYGVTATGGTDRSSSGIRGPKCPSGCGTIYRITPSGVETVLYSFGSHPNDAAFPSGPLLQARDGNLYGTAQGSLELGAVFKVVLGTG